VLKPACEHLLWGMEIVATRAYHVGNEVIISPLLDIPNHHYRVEHSPILDIVDGTLTWRAGAELKRGPRPYVT